MICVTGIDGAGKTTLAKALAEELTREGWRASYVYGKYVPILLRPAIHVASRLFARRKNYAQSRDSKRAATQRYKLLARLYRVAVAAEYCGQILWKVRLPLWQGRIVVCDRYIFDTVITDLAIDFNIGKDRIVDETRSMLRWNAKPDLTLFVDLQEDVAFGRKTDVSSVEYLRDRRELYRRLAFDLAMKRIDGGAPREHVLHQALEITREVIT